MGEGSQAPCGGGGAWGTPSSPTPGLWHGPHRSKKEARRRRSRTLCRVPALTWQFMSCALVMYTLVPEGGGRNQKMMGVGGKPPCSPLSHAPAWAQPRPPPPPDQSTYSVLLNTQERTETLAPPSEGHPTCRALAHKTTSIRKNSSRGSHPGTLSPRAKFLTTVLINPQTTL